MRPMFSTHTARRTSARRRARRCTPTPRKSVKTTGNSSGSAATASVTAESSASSQPKPWRSRTPASTTHSTRAATSRVRVRPATEIWSGVRVRVVCSAERRISPYEVSAPVTTTRRLALPVSSRVPAKAQCGVSMRAPAGAAAGSGRLRTGKASPVSADSSACSSSPASTRPSAGNVSPAATRTRSPGTTSSDAISCRAPSRTTLACVASRWRSPSVAARVRRCRKASMPTSGSDRGEQRQRLGALAERRVEGPGPGEEPGHRVLRGLAQELAPGVRRRLAHLVAPEAREAGSRRFGLSPCACPRRPSTRSGGSGRRMSRSA